MDTSETYVKMCGQAREIQAIRITKGIQHFGMGDWVTKPNFETHSYDAPICLGIYDKIEQRGHGFMECYLIWLPRQDQLQEMVKERYAVNLASRFHAYLMKYVEAPLRDEQPSMEQLWLAFVMKEKYGKTRNGTEWVTV